MSAVILIVLATIAAVLFARQEGDLAPNGRAGWARLVIYWLFTNVVAFEMTAGALWDLLKIEYARVLSAHLGYPSYMGDIIGVPRVPCALALLAPRFARLKEWAYAGAFFVYAGATASQYLTGGWPSLWVPPLVFCVITLASWALRPASRRLSQPAVVVKPRMVSWLLPVLITTAMVAIAYVTIPKGAPSH